jgi:hypothetical protein
VTVPRYPRIPYLWSDRTGTRNVVPPLDVDAWLTSPVRVEEKLDGANVSLWSDAGRLQVASRGGADAMDRAGQLGRLRAWAAERADQLGPVLAEGRALYGEWLWLNHSVAYDRLPDWLVVLDLWTPSEGLLGVVERDRVALGSGLALPPLLFDGVLGSREAALDLMAQSRFGSEPMEGVVLRRPDGERCKILRPGFRRRPDDAWQPGAEHNELASG